MGKYPLTNGIVLPSKDSLGEGCILVIRVDIGSRTAARGSLTPAPVPVRVVVRRVVRVRLAVRIVAAKWDQRTYQNRRGTTTTRSVHQKVWLFSYFAKVLSSPRASCLVAKMLSSSVQLNGSQSPEMSNQRNVKLPFPVVLGVDSRVKLVNAWIIWCDPHLSNVTTLSHILKGEANSTQYSKAICSKDKHVFGGPKRCVK